MKSLGRLSQAFLAIGKKCVRLHISHFHSIIEEWISKNEVYNLTKNKNLYAVLDIEMTPGQSEQEKRIIQWAVVWIENGVITRKESAFIYPECSIATHITKLTSITDEQVQNAPRFHETYIQLKELLEDRIIVGQNIQFDLQIISEEVKRINQKQIQVRGWIDTVEWSRVLHPTLLSYKLIDLVQKFDIQLSSAHLADADAEATAQLFLRLNADWLNLSLGVKKRLIPILKTLHSDYASITNSFDELMDLSDEDWLIFEKGYHFQHQACEQKFYAERIKAAELKKKLKNTKQMQAIFPNYEARENQIVFLAQLMQTWRKKTAKAFEVQPGMGKTFAYLVAGLSQLNEKNKQLLITTATKHLQTQIYQEQMPLVEQFFQKKISAHVLKGAQNYLCAKKFVNQLTTHDEIYDVRLAKAQILVWLQTTCTGDIDELNLTPNGEKFFYLCACSQKCIEPKKMENSCFYSWHIEDACNSDVLIINHALFVQKLLSENAALLKGCKIVVDEAHDLEKAIDQCGTRDLDFSNIFFHFAQIGAPSSKKLLEQYQEILQKYQELHPKNFMKFCNLLGELKRIFTSFRQEDNGYEKYRLAWLKTLDEGRHSIHKELKHMEQFKERLQDMIAERDQKTLFAFSYHLQQLQQYCELLMKYLQTHGASRKEQEKLSRSNGLTVMNYEVIQKVLTHLKKYQRQMVFCSGTLLVYGRSNFFLEGLDLKDQLEVEVIGEAETSENLTVYMPESQQIQASTSEEMVYYVDYALRFLIEKGHKKILILCNSKEMVEDLYAMISPLTIYDDFELVVQGRTSRSKEKLYEMFKSVGQGILLGAHSFYEGVDFPEETCTAVILPTLPFLSPDHPYIKARQYRADWIEPLVFMKVLLPSALLLFRQALGRLKRGNQVKKDFVLLDRRICTRTYKKLFLQTIEMEKKETIKLPLFVEKKST